MNLIIDPSHINYHVEPLPLHPDTKDFMINYKLPHRKISIKREEEFLAGRYCALMALKKYGLDTNYLETSADDIPVFPKGFSGSISHTKEFAISFVSDYYQLLGVDLEIIMTQKRAIKLAPAFLSSDEMALISENFNFYSTIIFSCKESIYKALFPLVGEYFGFKRAQCIKIKTDSVSFSLSFDKHKHLDGNYQCQYQVLDNKVLTWLALL